MTTQDVYQSLLDMYTQVPMGASETADSLIEVLRLQFTPQEAELAVKVGFESVKLVEIQRRTGMDRERLRKMLKTMAEKGTMWIDPGSEDPGYRTIGMAGPGLIETGGWGNIRFPHSIQLMKALHRLEVDFATKFLLPLGVPAARVWATPVALPADTDPKENVAERMKEGGYWGVSTCSCRLPHWIADPGNHCDHLLETCLFVGDMARWGVEHGICREITYEEAVGILHKSNENGLVHTHDPSQFICNCCADCCVFFVSIRNGGDKTLKPTRFIARMEPDTCTACGICADRCPVDAIQVDAFATVNEDRCLGCGVCYPTCPTESVSLVRRSKAEMT